MFTNDTLRPTLVRWMGYSSLIGFCFLLLACQPSGSAVLEIVKTTAREAATVSATPGAAGSSGGQTASAAGTEAAAAGTGSPEVKTEVVPDELDSQALAGNLLGDPARRMMNVILPPSYATSSQRYPVVYVLHATNDGESYAYTIKSEYEAMMRNGAAKEMIFVVPNANNRLGGGWYLNSPTIGDYETYLTKELVDYIDAHYRTLAQRDSRGITGCSMMGGAGAMHLALKFPDVYSVAAPMSGLYDWRTGPYRTATEAGFPEPLASISDLQVLPEDAEIVVAQAAGAASNPQKPPFYLDMPWAMVDGQSQPVASVMDKIAAASPWADAEAYAQQAQRLHAILLYQGRRDLFLPVKQAQAFDAHLTDLGIDHRYLETDGTHCSDLRSIISFMSDQLAFAQP